MSRRLVAVSLVMALALLGDSLLYVVLPLHATAIGLSSLQVGVLLSANRFVRMVTNRATAALLQRLSLPVAFAGAVALAAGTTALYALAPAFAVFVLARLLWGFCYSVLRLGCLLTVLADATEGRRGRAMGGYQAIARAGSFVAVVAGGALYDLRGYGFSAALMAGGTLLALPLALWQPPPAGDAPAPTAPPSRRPSEASVAGRPAVRWRPSPFRVVQWNAFTLAFVVRGVVTASLALLLRERFGATVALVGGLGVATLASWLIGARWAAEIGLAAPLGALSDRFGRTRLAAIWLVVAAGALLTLALAGALPLVVGGAALLFVAGSGLGATLDAAAGDLAPVDRRAAALSSYADWSDLGAALGPLLALGLVGRAPLPAIYLAGVGLLLAGAVAVRWAGRSPPPHAALPSKPAVSTSRGGVP